MLHCAAETLPDGSRRPADLWLRRYCSSVRPLVKRVGLTKPYKCMSSKKGIERPDNHIIITGGPLFGGCLYLPFYVLDYI